MGTIINITGAVACDECWRIIKQDKAAIVEKRFHGTKSKEMLCMPCYGEYQKQQAEQDEKDEPEQDDEDTL